MLLSRLPDLRRVFQYHGAEHKAIAAYENGVPLTPESAQRFTTAHVRCGTNFLLTVMVITIVVYSFIGRPGWALLILSRIILLPVIAGVSYEVIRFAAKLGFEIEQDFVEIGRDRGLRVCRRRRHPHLRSGRSGWREPGCWSRWRR